MPAKPIHVVYLIDYFHRTGGTERHLSHLVTLLPRESFTCTIVAFDLGENALLDAVRAHGVRVVHLPVQREYDLNGIRRAAELWTLLRNLRPDIVQTFHQKSDTYGAVIARLAGAPHLVSSKRDTGETRKPRDVFLNRRLKGLFERTIVVADAVGKSVAANDRLDPARLVRIYNGVDAREFRPPTAAEKAAARAQLKFAPDDFAVAMVAGFRPEKRHDVFFAGLKRALVRAPQIKVVLAGGGPLLGHYEQMCQREGLSGRVTFTGAVHDVNRYLHAVDAGCLVPGSNEGFSNAVLEKMAMGLPLIVTDVGGNAEAVVDGENGYIIPPSDEVAFSEALVKLSADPGRAAAMGQLSRRLVEQRFSLDSMWQAHASLYQAICAPGRP
jgi:glycosyltransferase involved in cell wall biosynthesis